MKRVIIFVALFVFAVVLWGCARNQPPTAEIIGLKDGDKVQKDVSFQGKGVDPEKKAITYKWDFGDGTKSTEQNPKHTYKEAGKDYTVTLVVIDDKKAESKPVKVKIYVNAPPVAVAEATPTSGKAPLTVEFDGSKSSDKEGTVAFAWDFNGDGATDSTEAKGSFTYEQPGIYTATLTVADDDGATASSSVTITVEGETAKGTVHTVKMITTSDGKNIFDPAELHIKVGDTVRWVNESGVHTTTAYHPKYGKELKIPEGAEPWDSGIVTQVGAAFEYTFKVSGTYEYFCMPHEALGMVGKITVIK